MALEQSLPSTCDVRTPPFEAIVGDLFPRRWHTLVGSSSPAAIITPSSEQDVAAVVRFAAANNLQVFPTAGGHGQNVTLDKQVIYLDLEKLRSWDIDAENGAVTIQGGATWEEVTAPLIERGLYCREPNCRIR
jgi:FAD/FMN-containing dehydrogenase